MVYNLILTLYWDSSCDMALTIPGIVNLDIEYGCGPSPPISLLMLAVLEVAIGRAGSIVGRAKIVPVFSGQDFNSPARPKNRTDRAK